MLPATEDTKGEIMGITAAINAFAFGTISFVGGGLQAIDEKAPLIVSFVLMFLSWVFLEVRRSRASRAGSAESRPAVGQAVNSLSSASNSSRGVSFRLMLPLGAPIPAHAPKASPGRAKCDKLVTVSAIFH